MTFYRHECCYKSQAWPERLLFAFLSDHCSTNDVIGLRDKRVRLVSGVGSEARSSLPTVLEFGDTDKMLCQGGRKPENDKWFAFTGIQESQL